jgi:hypothetical protein
VKLSPTQLRVLRAIAKENITWHYAGMQTRLRWYTSEYVYTTLSAAERRALTWLVEEDLAREVQGMRFGRGGYEVTPKGRALLDASRGTISNDQSDSSALLDKAGP